MKVWTPETFGRIRRAAARTCVILACLGFAYGLAFPLLLHNYRAAVREAREVTDSLQREVEEGRRLEILLPELERAIAEALEDRRKGRARPRDPGTEFVIARAPVSLPSYCESGGERSRFDRMWFWPLGDELAQEWNRCLEFLAELWRLEPILERRNELEWLRDELKELELELEREREWDEGAQGELSDGDRPSSRGY